MEVTDPEQEGGRRERPTLHELLQCEPTANEGREDGVNHSASASLAVLVLLPMIFAMALVPTHKELATLLYIYQREGRASVCVSTKVCSKR
jgi:hypothetical protein